MAANITLLTGDGGSIQYEGISDWETEPNGEVHFTATAEDGRKIRVVSTFRYHIEDDKVTNG